MIPTSFSQPTAASSNNLLLNAIRNRTQADASAAIAPVDTFQAAPARTNAASAGVGTSASDMSSLMVAIREVIEQIKRIIEAIKQAYAARLLS